MKTVEEVKTELKQVMAEFFAEVEKLMEKGHTFQEALATVSKSRPDLQERESQLRAYVKAVRNAEEKIENITASTLVGIDACYRRSGGGEHSLIGADMQQKTTRVPYAPGFYRLVAAEDTRLDSVEAEFIRQISAVTEIDPEISYARAMKLVASENPDLARLRAQFENRRTRFAGQVR